MNNINIFYFENDVGVFDEYNPRFVMQQPFAKEIVSLLMQKSCFFYSLPSLKQKFPKKQYTTVEKTFETLANISAISIKNGYVKLNFPFFTSPDLKIIDRIITNQINKSSSLFFKEIEDLKSLVRDLYPKIKPELTLYHLLCGQIFDGTMFNFLEERSLLKESFAQPGNRDYMIIAYDDNCFCNQYNKNLFCSFNNARYDDKCFSSFGNAFGERLDFFRYFKLNEIGKIYGKFKKTQKLLKHTSKDQILKNSFGIINELNKNKKVNTDKFVENLIHMNYLNSNLSIKVPVFDNYKNNIQNLNTQVINRLGDTVINDLTIIKQNLQKSKISCINHNVDEGQIYNEIYHIYFGKLNNFLIKNRIVATPAKTKKEGAYLKCIYLSD